MANPFRSTQVIPRTSTMTMSTLVQVRQRIQVLILAGKTMDEAVAAEPRVTGTAIQTVSGKKYDGFALLMVIERLS